MRFVKTLDEIRRIQKAYSRCHLLATKNLAVTFETSQEAVRALLPPPLEPTPEPLGSAWVGEIGNSNSVGPFMGAALYLRARYGDIIGNYCVTMPVSTPEALTLAHMERLGLQDVVSYDRDFDRVTGVRRTEP